ncbi:MAG: hypothetical protein KatS3mg102_2678 [Planctomycetota bacterium]|nr:MAG: hypothetical protein KatS3mg102_2678 [Planctomycetota bacterium]
MRASDHAPGSDAGLLIVLARSEEPHPAARVPACLPVDLPVPVDVFPLTRAELERRRRQRDRRLERLLVEGVSLLPGPVG